MQVVIAPKGPDPLEKAAQLMQENKLNEAESLLLRLLEKNPADAAANHKLAEIYLAVEKYPPALGHIMNAVQTQPDNAFYQYRLGYTLLKLQYRELAIKALQLAIRLDPAQAEPYPLLGTLFENLGREDEALAFYLAKADVLNVAEVFNAIARLYHKRHEFDAAHGYYTKALTLRPGLLNAQAGLASLLVKRMIMDCRYDQQEAATARTLCVSLIQHQCELALAKRTLADLESTEGKSKAAISHYREALELQPEDKSVRGNLAITLLRSGQYREGWAWLRWRQDLGSHDYGFASRTKAGVAAPQWTGETRPGMTLLVTSEQGVGDQILHAQHLLPLVRAGMRIILTCNVKLTGLFARSFPRIEVLPDNEPIPEALRTGIDAQAFLLDVPYFEQLDLASYTAPPPYLKADAALTEHFRQRYRHPGMNIGISWSSGSGSSGPGKSIPLQQLMPVLQIPGCRFVSIQYGDAVRDARALDQHQPGSITVDETFNPFDDLDKAAAQIAALDLVISVSNAAVHLAGALGVPTWSLTQHVPLWHWFEKREDSPWYSSVRLFRQPRHGDWESVVKRITGELVTSQ